MGRLAWPVSGELKQGDLPQSQMVRLAETDRPQIQFHVDGNEIAALAGDTLLVAILTNARQLRVSDFGDGGRAGFCLMGACQDCWVWTSQGEKLRACSTPAEAGMQITIKAPEGLWPRPA